MNRTYANAQISASSDLVVSKPSTEAQRLIVVILDAAEQAYLAGRILALARARALPVLLVGVAPEITGTADLRRKLVNIAAFMRSEAASTDYRTGGRDTPICIELQMEQGRDWLARVKSLVRPNDLLACYSEKPGGIRHKPLHDILGSTLNVPIYSFASVREDQRIHQSLLAQAMSWIGSLAAIGGFFLVEVRIVTSVQGWLQSSLLLVALFVETGLIWLLNSLLGSS